MQGQNRDGLQMAIVFAFDFQQQDTSCTRTLSAMSLKIQIDSRLPYEG